VSKEEEQGGPSCEDQAGADDKHQVSPNTRIVGADDEYQAEKNDQDTENPNEEVVDETYGVGPSVGNVYEYDMHALVGYEPSIVLNQVCSSFEESKSFVFDERLEVLVVAGVL